MFARVCVCAELIKKQQEPYVVSFFRSVALFVYLFTYLLSFTVFMI
jgi:hypothetical protein